MQEAGNLDDLDSAYTRQRIFAVSAYTLGAAALTQVSLHFGPEVGAGVLLPIIPSKA
jgi:hypothetical protein